MLTCQSPWTDASAPIWALVSGYASEIRLNKPLAFLQAFADDSASDKGERRLFIAGYLNRAVKWARFSDAWAEELKIEPSIKYLKMAEAQNLRGQFDWRKGWTEKNRDEKLRGLARVILHFKPTSFEFSVSREQFTRLVGASPRGLNPHFDCAFGAMALVARFAQSQKIKVPIDFIFDEMDGVSADMTLLFDQFVQGFPRRMRKLINGRPIFRDDKQFLPLQAADMLAWHLRREHEMSLPPGGLPMADRLRGFPHIYHQFDERILKSWGEKQAKIPGIDRLQSKSQWQRHRRELADALSRGFVPPRGIWWKNVAYRVQRRLARILRRNGG